MRCKRRRSKYDGYEVCILVIKVEMDLKPNFSRPRPDRRIFSRSRLRLRPVFFDTLASRPSPASVETGKKCRKNKTARI